MTLAEIVHKYVVELEGSGIPDPLSQRLTVSAVLFDLLTIAQQPVPLEIVRRVDDVPAVVPLFAGGDGVA